MGRPPAIDVLIVEDDRAGCELLVHAIQRVGLSTDVAANVVEAKRLLARGNYKVLVLDLILPDGTGSDVLEFIKAEKIPPLHIVLMTAAEPSQLVNLDRSMVKTVTFKPVDIDSFVQSVRDFASGR